MVSKILLCAFLAYFLLMSLTVERSYCARPLSPDDPGFLMKETYEFSVVNNRLFLERPEWLRQATCLHSYVFPFYYASVFLTTVFDLWHIRPLQFFFLCFVGAKLYAVGFYHYVNFTSHVPPENLIPYFATEGPYLAAIVMVVYNVWNAATANTKQKSS
jgi:uncharacterized membrane protein YidH (DUF202 family)